MVLIKYKNNQLSKFSTTLNILKYWVGCVIRHEHYVKPVTSSSQSLDAF